MEPYTQQEAFDKVWNHFVVNKGEKSVQYFEEFSKDMCMYRKGRDAASSTRCAIGVLLPDNSYEPAMDGADGIDDGILCRISVMPLFNNLGYSWIVGLQACHDSSTHSDNFTETIMLDLKAFATTHNLTIPA